MKIINDLNPIVIIVWEDFEKIISKLTKNQLMKIFFDVDLYKDLERMSKGDVISQIFLEYEEAIKGIF